MPDVAPAPPGHDPTAVHAEPNAPPPPRPDFPLDKPRVRARLRADEHAIMSGGSRSSSLGRWQLRPAAAARQIGFLGCLLGVVLCPRAWAEPSLLPEFKPEAARAYLQAVVQGVQDAVGDGPDACYALARIRNQLGEKEAAERWARRALERDPRRPDIQGFLADLLILQDRMAEAAGFLRQALALKPDSPGGHYRLGMALDRLGDREGARNALETAVRQASDDATTRLVLGRLLLDQGEVREAATHLEKACQLDPKLSGAFYALSQAWGRLGDVDGARRSLETFRELKQQEKAELDARNTGYDDERFMRALAAGFHTEVAGLLLRQQQSSLAEAHLRQAVLIAPAEPAAYEMLAGLLVKVGRPAEAREPCEALVRLRPSQATYQVNLGTLLLRLGDHPAALQALRRALDLDPAQPAALNNLARYYLGARREPAEALELSRRLADVQPTAASYDLLGWALYANGSTNEARAAAARAVELDPANPVYRERLERLGPQP